MVHVVELGQATRVARASPKRNVREALNAWPVMVTGKPPASGPKPHAAAIGIHWSAVDDERIRLLSIFCKNHSATVDIVGSFGRGTIGVDQP